jgi:flagellar biosynthetic protein FliR
MSGFMSLDGVLKFVPVFVLVLFRIAGFMLFAPLFGSTRIPRQVRVLFAVILAVGLTSTVSPPLHLPETSWGVAMGIGGEICFGLAMGMVLSFVFIAAQWAGEMIGQQMGFNLAETFDPSFSQGSTLVGDLYYMLTLVVFLAMGGHRSMIRGLRDSFESLPLLSVGIDQSIFDLITRTLGTCTTLAIRLAAPVLVTMMIVDLTLGFLGRTMPQLNVPAMGQSVKAIVGMVVLIIGLTLYSTTNVIQAGLTESIETVRLVWGAK